MNMSLATPAAHGAEGPALGLPTLDPSAGYVTIINTYEVAPERADELLDLLARATADTIRFVPGFVSANFHVNFDHTQIVNYAQWENQEAIAAARDYPGVKAWIEEAAKVATSFSPVPYKLRHSVLAHQE